MEKTLDLQIKNYGNRLCYDCSEELEYSHWKHIVQFNGENVYMGFCDVCSDERSKKEFDFINMENCHECKKLIGAVTPNDFRIGFDGGNTYFYCSKCYHLCPCKT